MKQLVVTTLLVLAFACGAFGQGFYDADSLHTIKLTFTQSNWAQILDSLFAAGNEDRLIGNVTIDGVEYDSVGVRYKGTSTYSPGRTKNPFNIKLDEIHSNQTINGYGTLKLSNAWFDPSFVREVLGYEIARKYMPASLANYANVYANDVLIGLYANVQDVDKLFMRTHLGSDENARFKGNVAGSPDTIYTIWGFTGRDTSNYTSMYELESDSGWTDLINFLDTLNNYTPLVEKVLDVDRHLWMLAYDNVLVNLDSPINYAHNYYLYRDDSHRFNPIIWDLNMDFGGFNVIVGGANLTIPQLEQLTPFLNQSNANYPIVNKILSNPTYKKQMVAHMKTIMAENFANNWYQARAQELQTFVDASVFNDPNKYSSYSNFTNSLNFSTGTTPGVVQLMNARLSYLGSLAPFQAAAPVISSITHTPAPVAAYSNVVVTASVTNATTVQLAYRRGMPDPFTKVTMFDDGNHNDGTAGDGVYGASMPTKTSDVHYYIYAENSGACSYAPARAEFEDSVVSVTPPATPPIVINEFLADNATIQADQNGQFDDWIELYNPSAASVSLKGCHLTDNPSKLGKWTFPDTSIAPNGYLIVWADDDGTQVGLHASFKLAASGEFVFLSDSSLAIIDSITFGAQQTDTSMGRCPNGSGGLVKMVPSFGLPNKCRNFVCSDADGNGQVNITDAVYLIQYIFAGGPDPNPVLAGDSNCDNAVNIADVVYLINYIFASGPLPCASCK